jgi:ABC-type sugar transport system ATPase subunit
MNTANNTINAQQETIIRAQGLSKKFGVLAAVDGIDFTVNKQECFGLLGPNGAGKTTAKISAGGHGGCGSGILTCTRPPGR